MMPVNPGEVLREEKETINIAANALSKVLCTSQSKYVHPEWSTRSKRRYSISACAIYWNYTEFAAQSAEYLGAASNEDRVLQVLCTILQNKMSEHELFEIAATA